MVPAQVAPSPGPVHAAYWSLRRSTVTELAGKV